jgi:hypothetical protein
MSDLSAKPEKNYRAKTKQADSQSGYLEDKIVGSTYINVTEEDGTAGKRLKVEVDASALGTAIDSGKFLVSSTDTTKDYLYNKLVAGNAITLVKQNPAGNEKIIIDANYTEGTGIYITADTISLDADLDDLNDVVIGAGAEGQLISYDSGTSKFVNTDYAMETTFSGTTSKVPNSDAVADLLRALYITNATDCGSGGNSIMYKTISIPVSNSCICEGQPTSFSDHYPSNFGSFDLLQNNLLTFAERSLGLKLITTETDPSDQGDGYGAVLLEAMIDEDCSDNNTIFLDTVIQTKDNRGVDAQTNLRCFAVGFNEGQATEISTVSDVKILDAAGNGLYKKVSFAIDLNITASSPFSIKFILFSGSALIAADAGYQSVDEFTLLSARVRYPIKTINLRNADINM